MLFNVCLHSMFVSLCTDRPKYDSSVESSQKQHWRWISNSWDMISRSPFFLSPSEPAHAEEASLLDQTRFSWATSKFCQSTALIIYFYLRTLTYLYKIPQRILSFQKEKKIWVWELLLCKHKCTPPTGLELTDHPRSKLERKRDKNI